jgi:hypothetical protein
LIVDTTSFRIGTACPDPSGTKQSGFQFPIVHGQQWAVNKIWVMGIEFLMTHFVCIYESIETGFTLGKSTVLFMDVMEVWRNYLQNVLRKNPPSAHTNQRITKPKSQLSGANTLTRVGFLCISIFLPVRREKQYELW